MNNMIDGDNGKDCHSPKHMGCEKCEGEDLITCEYCGEEIEKGFKCQECLRLDEDYIKEIINQTLKENE